MDIQMFQHDLDESVVVDSKINELLKKYGLESGTPWMKGLNSRTLFIFHFIQKNKQDFKNNNELLDAAWEAYGKLSEVEREEWKTIFQWLDTNTKQGNEKSEVKNTPKQGK